MLKTKIERIFALKNFSHFFGQNSSDFTLTYDVVSFELMDPVKDDCIVKKAAIFLACFCNLLATGIQFSLKAEIYSTVNEIPLLTASRPQPFIGSMCLTHG